MSTCLDLILFLLNEVSSLTLEKSHSAGTEVEGMARYVLHDEQKQKSLPVFPSTTSKDPLFLEGLAHQCKY